MSAAKRKERGVPIGTVNNLEVTLGQRGQGKSTFQCARARELSEEFGGAYVLGHSLGGRLPKKLPEVFGGGELPISYHTTIKELDRELHRHPARWHVLAPPIVGSDAEVAERERESCDDLIRYTMRLSQSLRDQAFRKAHPTAALPGAGLFRRRSRVRDYDGLPATPIILVIDEGVAVEAASTGQKSKGQDKWFLEWIYSLRHLHTALLYAIQNPTARNWQLMSESTRVTCFHVRHEWAINAIRAAGATSYELDLVKVLRPHEYVTLSEDEGPKDEDDEIDDVREPDDSVRGPDAGARAGDPGAAPTPSDAPVSSPTVTEPERPPAV